MNYSLPQAHYLAELIERRKGRDFAVMARVVRTARFGNQTDFRAFVRALESA